MTFMNICIYMHIVQSMYVVNACAAKQTVVLEYIRCRHGHIYPAINCRAHAHYNYLAMCLVHSHAFLTQKGMTDAAMHLHLVVYATDSDMHCQY